jgi:hypothetical protein
MQQYAKFQIEFSAVRHVCLPRVREPHFSKSRKEKNVYIQKMRLHNDVSNHNKICEAFQVIHESICNEDNKRCTGGIQSRGHIARHVLLESLLQ